MFRKVCHVLRMVLLALVVQIANLSNIEARKVYNGQHRKQGQLRYVENDLKQEIQWDLNDSSRLPLNSPSAHQLNLSGKLEPASDLPTINLSSESSGFGTRSGKCFFGGSKLACDNRRPVMCLVGSQLRKCCEMRKTCCTPREFECEC